ncbi:MAG TPA: hypothetical protein VK453_13920 [Micromonosporaceae bacterium]|nr:hypothetical protein [Micromonosporaceae bacterium]
MTTPPTTPYRYFVSFATPYGFGNTEISLHLPVRGMPDVQVITDLLAKGTGTDGVTVLYFTELPTVLPKKGFELL